MKELLNNISGFNAAFLVLPGTGNLYDIYLVLGKGLLQRRQEIQQQLEAKRQNGSLRLTISAENVEQAEATILEKIRGILQP